MNSCTPEAQIRFGRGSFACCIPGPTGLGLVAKQVADFMKAYTELRELPDYLPWRLQLARS